MEEEREYKSSLEQRQRVKEYYRKNKTSIALKLWANRNKGKTIEEIAGIIKKKKLTKKQKERLANAPKFSIEHKKVLITFD